jgi:hypothetical protein
MSSRLRIVYLCFLKVRPIVAFALFGTPDDFDSGGSMRYWFRFAFCAGILIGWASFTGKAEATAQFALLTGNRCINCHITTQGGGQRDELGQYAMDGVGLLAPGQTLPGRTTFPSAGIFRCRRRFIRRRDLLPS